MGRPCKIQDAYHAHYYLIIKEKSMWWNSHGLFIFGQLFFKKNSHYDKFQSVEPMFTLEIYG